MFRLDKNFPIVPIPFLLFLAVLLAACRVGEGPDQTAYPALATRQMTASSTLPPATRKPAPTAAALATAGRTLRPTAAPSPSPTPLPTRGDVAFSLTLLYTGEVHGEVRPCG